MSGVVTQARLDALRTGFDVLYQAAYANAATDWQRFASETSSDSLTKVHGWIAQQLAMKQWKGQRTARTLIEHVHEVENDDFEETVEVDRNKIEDDNLSLYRDQLIPQLGVAVAKHPDTLIADMMVGNAQPGVVAYKGKTWDGKALYATNHPTFNGAGSYSNEHSSKALTKANLVAIRAEMRAIKGEDGKPLGVSPNLLVVGPALWDVALELTQAVNIAILAMESSTVVGASAPSNVIPKMGITAMEWDYLSDFDDLWFLMDTSKPVKPFARQLRRAPEFVSRTRADDPKVFETKQYTFGVDYRGTVVPTLPWLQARCYGEATAPEAR